jgi:hypothetical protein
VLAVRRFVFLLAAFFLTSSLGHAQQTDGVLEGRVLGDDAQAVEGVKVVASGPSLQGQRTTFTNRAGEFRLLALPVGSYRVTLTHVAHRQVTLDAVVQLGSTTSIGVVRLERAVVQLPEVQVRGTPRTLDPTTAVLGGQLSRDLIATLPSDRDFRSLETVLPQVNTTFSGEGVIRDEPGAADANISGSTGEGNFYFIDGNDVTSVQGAGARTSMSLPFDFIQAIDVKTGGAEAEYGRAMGGIVNVITPSGGNVLHGQLFGYFTNHDLLAKSRNNESDLAGFATYDVGTSLDGPLVHDRLWFLAAYNPIRDHRHQPIPGLPDQDVSSSVQRFAAKLTWQADDKTRLAATLLGDPGRGHSTSAPVGFTILSPEAVTANTRTGAIHASLDATRQLRNNLLLRADASVLHDHSTIEPISQTGLSEPQFTDAGQLTLDGGYGGEKHDHGQRVSARFSTTWLPPGHLAKLGLEYVDNAYSWNENFGTGRGGGGYVTRYDDTTWTEFQYHLVGTVHMRVPTAYVQDSWRASEGLRLNVGLRWDGPHYVARDGETKLRVQNQIQPRIGLIYTRDSHATDKISGSWGQYFEQLSAGNPGTAFVDVLQFFQFLDHDPRLDPPVPDTAGIATLVNYGSLRGEFFDEWTLGYDRQFPASVTAGVHGIVRRLREVIEDAFVPSLGTFRVGNPGRGDLAHLPRPTATYSALVFTLAWSGERTNVSTSYVLSRNHGNYEGLELGNSGPQYDWPRSIINDNGDLPNDHRHVFKLNATHATKAGLALGGTGLLQSGTPLSELGGAPDVPYGPVFLLPRGTAGRTPWTWDLNARIRYDLPGDARRWRPRAIVDLFHLFNPRRALAFDQQRFFSLDAAGNPTSPNPNYGAPILFQPSFSARFGVGASF